MLLFTTGIYIKFIKLGHAFMNANYEAGRKHMESKSYTYNLQFFKCMLKMSLKMLLNKSNRIVNEISK